MAFIRSLSLLTLFIWGTTFILAGGNASGTDAEVHSVGLNANVSTGNPLLAPLYHNVTAGEVWVYPSSKFDLGARSMSCECFDPADSCCMPKSTDLAPFCMPKNSTCCADTFCVAGETCCGDFCCAANTTCNLKTVGSGCCPEGTICTSPPKCYDHSSSNCTNILSPRQECCPADLPYCRDFSPIGLGCYASSTLKAVSPIGGTPTPSNPHATPTATISMESTVTVTISMLSNEAGLSIAFPAITTSGIPASTKYVLNFPGPSSSSTSSSVPSSTSATSTPPTASSISPSSTHPSPLCFNTDLQSPAPCSSTSTSTMATTSPSSPPNPAASSNYSPPGASIYRSPASRPHPWTLPHLWNQYRTTDPPPAATSLPTILTLLALTLLSSLWLLSSTLRKRPPPPASPTKKKTATTSTATQTSPIPSPHLVPGSGRRLTPASPLDREITVLRETGRFVERGNAEVVPGGLAGVVEGGAGAGGEVNDEEEEVEGIDTAEGKGNGEGKGGLDHVFVFHGGDGGVRG